MDLKKYYRLLHEIITLPRVEIRMWGDEHCHHMYRYFVRPHPHYWVIQNKSIGAAILPLPASFEEYTAGKKSQALRTNRTRCLKQGFSFQSFQPDKWLEDLMEINASSPVRQGRKMYASYTEVDQVRTLVQEIDRMYGVFNQEGRLRAYAHVMVCGELILFSRLLGHAEDLEQGVMYLLVSEVLKEMIALKAQTGLPHYAMYDTFFGALPGLRYFKERLGFSPYRVRWKWVEKPCAET
jgi:hypothetical protein